MKSQVDRAELCFNGEHVFKVVGRAHLLVLTRSPTCELCDLPLYLYLPFYRGMGVNDYLVWDSKSAGFVNLSDNNRQQVGWPLLSEI